MLRQTKGTAIAVSDNEMLHAGRELASLEGVFAQLTQPEDTNAIARRILDVVTA